MLFLDGVYIGGANGHPMRFLRVKAPTKGELTRLTHTIAQRVGRYLERQGLLERDTGNIYLTPEAVDASDEDPSNQLLGSSITYRIAVGPQQGRKVFTLQTLPDCESDNPFSSSVGEVAGFSLHAGVATKANERTTKSRRPQASWEACAVTLRGWQYPRNVCHCPAMAGQVRYELKTPWRNGTRQPVVKLQSQRHRMPRAPIITLNTAMCWIALGFPIQSE